MSKEKIGPFSLKLYGACGQEGFAHDCLVAGTRETVGLTFFKIDGMNYAAKEMQGQVSAVVWMPRIGAQELHRQLGEALVRLESTGEDEVVLIDHTPKQGPRLSGWSPGLADR